MTTDAPVPPAPVETAPAPAPGVDASPTRREARNQRRRRERSWRGLLGAILVCAAVPTAVALSLWNNLTEPFGFNEQWRAYYVSNPGSWFEALKSDGAPFPAGWYFLERLSGWLFGSTELALRLPTVLFLPVGCVLLLLLARRWMPTGAAVVVALVGALTGTLVSYSLQLSEYQVDAAAVVAVILLHDVAWDADRPTWRSLRVYLAYGGVALACIFSTPVIFVAGPLLLLDALRLALRRTFGVQMVGAVGAGLIVLSHLVAFVLPQSALRSSPYWDPQFLPHDGIGHQATFVWHNVGGFVSGVFTSSSQSKLPGFVLTHAWMRGLTAVFALLLCLGVMEAARSARGRTILFAIVASQVLTLVASYLRYWPFGFVRTNFYLIPLLMLLAGIGGFCTGRYGLSLVRGPESPPAATRRHRWPGVLGGVALCVLVVAGIALAATGEVGAYRQTRGSNAGYGSKIGLAVATVRTQARPGAAVVVTGGVMTTPGWKYYQYEYTGKATDVGHQIATSQLVFPVTHGSAAITALVDRLHPAQVFLYIPGGTSGPELGLDTQAIAKGRVCRQESTAKFVGSGELFVLSCSQR